MPYLKLDTNVPVDAPLAEELLRELSEAVSRVTEKPESVVQVAVDGGKAMLMAKTTEPTAHVEIKGIGFPEGKARAMSEAVCSVLGKRLDIKGNRIYIAFVSYKGSMWGVDGGTF